MKKWNLLLTVGLATILTACGSTTTTTIKEDEKVEESIQIALTQNERSQVITEKEVVITEGDNLMDIMNEQFDLTTAYDGTFITGIDGIMAREEDRYSWIFYINNELAMKGASDLAVTPGDKIEFSLEKWK